MGRAILVMVAASILGLVSISYVGQQTRVATEETTADYEYKVVARDIAHSGLDKALSETRTKHMSAQKAWTNVSMGGGSYDVSVVDNMYGDITMNAVGTANEAEHSVQTNVIFEVPLPAAVVLSGNDVQSTANGLGFIISGVDKRSPSVASGNGFLSPVYGVIANTPDNANKVMASMQASNVVGQGGDGSISNGVDVGAYNALYAEAMASSALVIPTAPHSGTFGTAQNPKVVYIPGDFSPTLQFSGAGLLIIEDGDVQINGNFDWEGLVLIRRVAQSNISITISGDATIHGGLVAMEATGAVSSTECVDVPFTIDGLSTVPQVPFAVRFDVLGAAISAGGLYDMPVTSQVHLGDVATMPWGSYSDPIAGNLNTGGKFNFEPDSTFAAGTGVTLSGRSWKKKSGENGDQLSEWELSMEQNSVNGGSQLMVLRNGDTVPNLAGYLDQQSAEGFVADYIGSDGKMKLAQNQSIYLFELGSTNQTSPAWDMQDLVVVITLVRADMPCEVTASTAGSIDFAVGGTAQINFSGEAVAKIGSILPSVQASSLVVIASQKESVNTVSASY